MKKHSKFIIVLVLISSVIIASSPFVSAATDGYIDLPVSFNNSWLDGYGVIQPDTHQGSRFEYDLPDGSFTTNTIFSTQYYCSDDNIMSSYNDFLFKISTFDMICERVYLNFYGYSEEYEFTLDSVDGLTYYYSLEFNNFNWQNNIFSISFVFKTMVSGEAGHLVIENMYYRVSDTSVILGNQNQNAQDIQDNQDKNTDRILGAGSDIAQPDFDSTNGQIDSTVDTMQSIEGEYQIDAEETQTALDKYLSFREGTDMQRASIQVKNWIEGFYMDNVSYGAFLVAAMVLGLCFWIIGRKAGGD